MDYLVVANCVSSLTVSSPSPQGTTILTVEKDTVTFIVITTFTTLLFTPLSRFSYINNYYSMEKKNNYTIFMINFTYLSET